jgi:hypothetical protein
VHQGLLASTVQSQLFLEARPMMSGFKQFILRGNVVDMAVGVVVGRRLREGDLKESPAKVALCGGEPGHRRKQRS